jgi:RNA polymerase sigma-B factor
MPDAAAVTHETRPAGPAGVAALIVRWQRDGDARAREALISQFLPLARGLARRYQRSSMPVEDLVQVASLGLIKAIDRFDVDRGGTLQAYAVPTILGELRRHFRDTGWAVHVPRGAQERALAVRGARERLENRTGRSPTATELAQYMESDVEGVIDGLIALSSYETTSLDAPLSIDAELGGVIADAYGEEDPGYELAEHRATLAHALQALPRREREMLRMRFDDELTQATIARKVGVSQMQVSRLLRRSLEAVRTSVDDRADAAPNGLADSAGRRAPRRPHASARAPDRSRPAT